MLKRCLKMTSTMSLMSGKIAGISVLSSEENILKGNGRVMIQNKGGMFEEISFSVFIVQTT
jgi:hypothetical protein